MKRVLYFLIFFVCLSMNTSAQKYKKKSLYIFSGETVINISNDSIHWGLANEDGSTLVPMKYESILPKGDFFYCYYPKNERLKNTDGLDLYNKNGQCLLPMSSNSRFITNGIYNNENVVSFGYNTDVYVTFVMNSQGKILYKYKVYHDSRGFKYLKNELADTIVIGPGYNIKSLVVRGDYICYKIGHKEGACNLDGSIIIPCGKYGNIIASNDHNGFSVYLNDDISGILGYVNRKGEMLFPALNYTRIFPAGNGDFCIKAQNYMGVADSTGTVKFMTKYHQIIPKYDANHNLYYETHFGNGVGKMKSDGTVIAAPSHKPKMDFDSSKPYTIVTDDSGLYGVKNNSGQLILPYEYANILPVKNRYFSLFNNEYEGMADFNGKIIIPCNKYHRIYLREPYIHVKYMGKVGLCDMEGNEILPPMYDDISVIDDLFRAEIGTKKGIVDKQNRIMVPFDYTEIWSQKGGNYIVELFCKKGMCDRNGKIIIPPLYTDIDITTVSNKKYFIVSDGNSQGIYNTIGDMLFPTGRFQKVSINSSSEITAFNPQTGETITFDLSGNIIRDGRTNKNFDRAFQQAWDEFEHENYKRSIELYNTALSYKQDGIAYYNIGAAYYNLSKYKDAINNLKKCLALQPSQNIIDKANDLIVQCQLSIQDRNQRRTFLVLGILGGALNVAGSIINANNATKAYNVSHAPMPAMYNTVVLPDVQTMAKNAMNDIQRMMDFDKEQFLTKFRKNFIAAEGREPTEQEEMVAYTQHLEILNAATSASTSIQSSNSFNSSYGANSVNSNDKSMKSKPCKSCEIPGFGNTPGNGNCRACKGMKFVDSGFSLDQISCTTCKNSGNPGKCTYCHGTGWQ